MAKSKDPSGPKVRVVISHVLPDGRLSEMIHVPKESITGFVIGKGNEKTFATEIFLDSSGKMTDDNLEAKTVLLPLRPDDGFLNAGFLKFPSHPEEYGSPKELFSKIKEHLKKYVVLDEHFYDVAALYVMVTWVYDRFNALPYLRVVGNYGTGKSRFLDVVGGISFRAMMAGGISMAALYRTSDMFHGTLVHDEADFHSSDMSSSIVKILNSGHRKGMPVIRMEGEGVLMKPRTFDVFGPKILGSRELYNDIALESRCLTQRLFPKSRVGSPVHLPEVFEEEALSLRNQLLAFRLEHFYLISDDEESLSDIQFPRLKQSALAVTSLAKYVDKTVLKSVIEFLAKYEETLRRMDGVSFEADVLLCILRLAEFNDSVKKSGKVYMKDIAEEFDNHMYEEYKERATLERETREGPLVSRGQVVSPRRIGGVIDKRLGFEKMRDGRGFYIHLAREHERLVSLSERHGLDQIIAKERVERSKPKPKVPITYSNKATEDFEENTASPLEESKVG